MENIEEYKEEECEIGTKLEDCKECLFNVLCNESRWANAK